MGFRLKGDSILFGIKGVPLFWETPNFGHLLLGFLQLQCAQDVDAVVCHDLS